MDLRRRIPEFPRDPRRSERAFPLQKVEHSQVEGIGEDLQGSFVLYPQRIDQFVAVSSAGGAPPARRYPPFLAYRIAGTVAAATQIPWMRNRSGTGIRSAAVPARVSSSECLSGFEIDIFDV
jgi:hypothetical protein